MQERILVDKVKWQVDSLVNGRRDSDLSYIGFRMLLHKHDVMSQVEMKREATGVVDMSSCWGWAFFTSYNKATHGHGHIASQPHIYLETMTATDQLDVVRKNYLNSSCLAHRKTIPYHTRIGTKKHKCVAAPATAGTTSTSIYPDKMKKTCIAPNNYATYMERNKNPSATIPKLDSG